MNKPNSFVTEIDKKQGAKLLAILQSQDFEITQPQYTVFSAKKPNLSCTYYESGKLVVQGKESGEFIEFVLEPEVLEKFAVTLPANGEERIGIDESGKGDFFGPLTIAGVFVTPDQVEKLHKLGVKDSKQLSDQSIKKLAAKIRENCLYHIVKINPPKYNEIYSSFKNLNSLLAWGHATAIENLAGKSGCKNVIIDQFANEYVVINALKRKKISLNLTQRHRGEEDLAVAAASILARDAFVDGLDKLGKELGIILPKGAGAEVIRTGKKILNTFGMDILMGLCKHHFKTLDAILGKEREL